ncbi:putative Zinc finger, RING-type [Plasmopara halstedii]
MSLGNREDSEAAAQDEGDWVSRNDSTSVLTSADSQVNLLSSTSSNGLVNLIKDDEETSAIDLAVLGDTCSICLQTLVDPVMLTTCYHVYCLECLSTWAHSLALHGVVRPTCPLCKNPFEDVYANVRSETDFELLRFQGRRIHNHGREKRQNNYVTSRERRRSLVYRRHMRLARVAGNQVEDLLTFPKMHKVQGEYEAWIETELRACIGRDIELTVLLAIIQCCLNKITQCGPAKCYDELQQALTPFLYEDAGLFVRELAFFLGSRLNVDAYDAAVEYCCENAAECENTLCAGS